MAVSPQHVTLTAATVATLTFDSDFSEIDLTFVAGTTAVYFTMDGTTPVGGAAGTHVLVPVIGTSIRRKPRGSTATVVKLISSGTPTVSVRGSVDGNGVAL